MLEIKVKEIKCQIGFIHSELILHSSIFRISVLAYGRKSLLCLFLKEWGEDLQEPYIWQPIVLKNKIPDQHSEQVNEKGIIKIKVKMKKLFMHLHIPTFKKILSTNILWGKLGSSMHRSLALQSF